MLLTGLALFLSIAGIAVFPCWRYSTRWSFAPSATAGILLFFVAVLIVGGKAVTSEALAARLSPPPPRQQAMVEPSTIEKVSQEKASPRPSVLIAGPPIPLLRNVAEP